MDLLLMWYQKCPLKIICEMWHTSMSFLGKVDGQFSIPYTVYPLLLHAFTLAGVPLRPSDQSTKKIQ